MPLTLQENPFVKFRFEFLDELPSVDDTTKFFVAGLIVESGLNFLCGAPGCSKSLFALDLAYGCTHNRKFLNLFEVPQGKVLYIDSDSNNPRELNKRILNWGFEAGSGLIRMQQQPFRIDIEEDVRWLLQQCQEEDVKLVIFDSLIRFHRCNEYSAPELAILRLHLQMLTAAGITVIVLHHNAKNGRFRGSSELSAMADSMISITKIPGSIDKFILQIEKERSYSEDSDFESIGYVARSIGGVTALHGYKDVEQVDPLVRMRTKILAFCTCQEGKTKTEIRAHVEGDTTKADTAIKQLLETRPGLRMEKRDRKLLYFYQAPEPLEEEIEVEIDSEQEDENLLMAC